MGIEQSYQHPHRTLTLERSGGCVVEFSITETGNVGDVRMLECDSPDLFSSSAKESALEWKYKPRVANGQAVIVDGHRAKLTYEIID